MEVIKRFGGKVLAGDVSASVAGADRRRHDRLGSKTEVAALRRDVCFAPDCVAKVFLHHRLQILRAVRSAIE
jgi:hypothetical protein